MSASAVAQLRPPDTPPNRHERSDDLPLSPELVLVDPELARWARSQLPDIEEVGGPPRHIGPVVPRPDPVVSLAVPLPAAPVAMPLPEAPSQPVIHPLPARRRRSRLLAVGYLVLAFVTGAIVGNKVFDGGTGRVTEQSASGTQPAPPQGPRATSAPTSPQGAASPSGARGSGRGAAKHKSRPAKAKPTAGAIPAESVRLFSWTAVPTAAYYAFSLYRGSERIFSARPPTSRLTLPAAWTYGGNRFRLRAGRYRWVVRPALRSGRTVRLGRAIVSARLIVGR